ncbi:MAG: T9SS type A sorting domain-containing protein [Bacteroidales bacterium]|nr:T9SS type A sorting domain-containing protein [Bacteroidales bacterium]
MKKFITLLIIQAFITGMLAQNNAPVAVDDTVVCYVGQTVTVNVVQNDYDPDGDSFRVFSSTNSSTFTDSTVSFNIDTYQFFGYFGEYKIVYLLKDEHNLATNDSRGNLVLQIVQAPNSFDSIDIGNIAARINPHGNQFWAGMTSYLSGYQGPNTQFNFPKGSSTFTVFNSALWIGGKDQNGQLHVSAERYRQVGRDFVTGPLSVDGLASLDSANSMEWMRVWKLNRTDIDFHITHNAEPGYVPIDNIATWPAHGKPALNQSEYLAPFVDNNNDGIYNPLDGDYPLIRGDQSIFFIFNDMNTIDRETGSNSPPLGIEIHGMAYGFNYTDSDLANTIFLNYKIFNRSANDYSEVYSGVFCDFDIGLATDDYLQCDVKRGSFIGMNGDSIDGNGEPGTYGLHPPAQSITILGGPFMDPDNLDNPLGGCDYGINGANFDDGIVDNERMGMTGFIYFNNGGPIYQSDPSVGSDYYNSLKGIWKDGSVMQYGGNGHYAFGGYGPAARFMFPGTSDSCFWGTGGVQPFGPVNWTEITAGNTPADRRGLGVSGPFTFAAGTYQQIDLAFVTAQSIDNLFSSYDKLLGSLEHIKFEYNKNPQKFGQYIHTGIGEELQKKPTFDVYPNPATEAVNIVMEQFLPNTLLEIRDMTGRILEVHSIKSQNTVLGVQNLTPGIYLLRMVNSVRMSSRKLIIR